MIPFIRRMSKEIKIAPVDQYIIDQVRRIRKELGITAENLSEKVSPSKNIAFIGNIESSVKAATYTDHNLNIIARIFSEHTNKNYTIYDFYPENFLDDNPIVKTALKLPSVPGPARILRNLIASDYFDDARTLREITEKANEIEKMNWLPNSFSSPTHYAVGKNQLIRIDLQDGSVMYQKAPAVKKNNQEPNLE